MMIKPKKTAKKKKTSKLTYAVMDFDMNHLYTKDFDSHEAFQRLLDNRKKRGKARTGVHLNGSNRKIGKALLLEFDQNIEKAKEWLEPRDIKDLKAIVRVLKAGPAKLAMIEASRLDTIVRDEIPSKIWKAMGGEVYNN